MAELDFDAGQIDPSQPFDIIPAGWYPVCVVESEIVEARSGNGKYLKIVLQILHGPLKNRKLWDNLNLWHHNSTAMQIAKGQFSALSRAVGIPSPRDTSELHMRPLAALVRVQADKPKAGPPAIPGQPVPVPQPSNPRNVIKGYATFADKFKPGGEPRNDQATAQGAAPTPVPQVQVENAAPVPQIQPPAQTAQQPAYAAGQPGQGGKPW